MALNLTVSCANLLLGDHICETSGVRVGQKSHGNCLVAFSAGAHWAYAQVSQGWRGGGRQSVLCGCCLQDTQAFSSQVHPDWFRYFLNSHLEGWGHTRGYTQRQSKAVGVTLDKVWGGMGERWEVLHRRLTREGAGLCKKEWQTKKSGFPVETGRKLHAGVSFRGKGGVCLHAIKTAREASMGEEWPGSFILVAAVEQPSRAGMSWDQWLGKKGSLVSWSREVSSIIVPGHAVTGKSLPQTFPKQWVSSVPLASHFGQIGKKLQPCLLSYSCHYRNILLTCLIRTQTRSFLCVCETRQNGLLSGIDWCSFPAKFLFQHSIELLRNPQYCSTAVTK